jgi:hypothetical protein
LRSGPFPAAAAHVCGVAALYKASFGDAASSTIASWLSANASTVTCGSTGASYKLLYKSTL